MKRRATIFLILALLLMLSSMAGVTALAAGKCKTCGDTGVCVNCEGSGECTICSCSFCNEGVCKTCYGVGTYYSPYTYKGRDCIACYNGQCKYCNGKGWKSDCTICLGEGKCWSCGGDGGCADCQWLNPDARVLREQLIANLNGKRITLEEAEKILIDMLNECNVCAGLGECNSCDGNGYERCPKMCKPGDICFSCNQGYRDCNICGGSGMCRTCGGDGQK